MWVQIAAAVISAMSKSSSVDQSQSSSRGLSGTGFFGAENEVGFAKPYFDAGNPAHVVVGCGLVVAGMFAYKKWGK